MTLNNPELIKAKKQLVEQIKNTFPEDKKNSALEQLESMNDEQFVQFLEQNNLLQNSKDSSNSAQGIFRAIVSGKIPSTKIAENNSAIAVLEINPLSKGHTIIIPKNPVTSEKDLPKEISSLAEQISKNLKEKLKAKNITTSNSKDFGEVVINLIPLYNQPLDKLKKYKAEKSELEEVEKILFARPKEVIKKSGAVEKKQKPLTKKDFWLPKRIP